MVNMKFEVGTNEIEVAGIILSRTQIACKLPDSGSYKISISYDKKVYTTQITILVFSSICYSCDPNTLTCTQKVGKLMIMRINK